MRSLRIILVAILLFGLGAAVSGRFLVVDEPKSADILMVIAGETDRRPARGLELLAQGFAPRMILNVPAGPKIYQWTQPELAAKYIQGLPGGSRVTICPITGLSTKAEAGDAESCLRQAGARRVLLVTSDYHTRRALSVFSRELPGYEFSVAAAYDPREFSTSWWQNREWAKTNLNEWLRLMWWELVDRWH